MPPVRTQKRSASPAEVSPSSLSHALTLGSSAPSSQLSTRPLSYAFPDYDAASPPAPKKKRSHGKARPPGHIPRPPNAFIIFRTEYIKSMATQNSTPEMSKNLGSQWKSMSATEKRPWIEKAREAKEEHQKQFPGYKYKPVHPRDADGKCIRKPRKPNQPRVKTVTTDVIEGFSTSFAWMEGKTETEYHNAPLPSDCSSASSPPRSPSPALSTSFPQPSYQAYRRSSSVPLPAGDDRFFFGLVPEASGSMYASSPGVPHTGHVSRRLSKRPSTSMDFACAGPPNTSEMYVQHNTYLAPNGDSSQWRLSHRRSISAPMFGGDAPIAQFTQAPTQEFPQTPNHLTPINPVFGNVFDKFSWDSTSNTQFTQIVPPQHPYTGLDIPSMTHSPLSNGSTTPPATTPNVSPSSPSHVPPLQHPAPVSTFDFSAFQAQIGDFDAVPNADVAYSPMVQPEEGLGNVLGLESYQPGQLYSGDAGQAQGADQPFYQQHVQAQYSEGPQVQTYPHAADMSGYREGIRYTEVTHTLDINELIVEGY